MRTLPARGSAPVSDAILFVCAMLAGCATRQPESAPTPEIREAAAPTGSLVSWDDARYASEGLVMKARTTFAFLKAGTRITLADTCELRRSPGGDFDLSRRRTHTGSDLGDSDESFRAVRIGKDYYTRGSGGPFVKWDDAHEEPIRAASAALSEVTDLLSAALACGSLQGPDERASLVFRGGDCRLAIGERPGPLITAMSGVVERPGGAMKSVALKLRLRFDTGSGVQEGTLTHNSEFMAFPVGERISVPLEVVASRRERPVKMVETVLSGLLQTRGPGWPVPASPSSKQR